MTIPVERARSMRWGWEFLWNLQSATNLEPPQLSKVEAILRHYPSTQEIEQWAIDSARIKVPQLTEFECEPFLQREDHEGMCTELQPGVPLRVDRGPTTPQERLQALYEACNLFNADLRQCNSLTPEQRRTLMYVRRHFPAPYELDAMARLEVWAVRAFPGRRVWLLTS